MKQTTFTSPTYQSKEKRIRRELVLAETDQVVPLAELLALKMRYRGQAKNAAQLFTLIGPTTL